MKNILIIEKNWVPISFIKNNISGTTYINKLIMEIYHNDYNIYYCTSCDVEFNDRLSNINHIKYDFDNLNLLINQVKNINFQLCIFTSDNQQEIIKELHKYCNINKYLLINHFPYWIEESTLYNKVIAVYKHNNFKNKYVYIHNPFNKSYENINLNNIQKDHSIILCCGKIKISDNEINRLINISSLVRKQIPNFCIKLCYPQYDYNDTIGDFIINLGSLSHEELQNELLKTPISYRIYDFIESCSIGSMFEAICGCLILSNFHDGMNNNFLSEYINKYNCKNKSDEEISKLIIDIILNYDKYKNDIISNQQYIYNNFFEYIIIKQYKKEIDELL